MNCPSFPVQSYNAIGHIIQNRFDFVFSEEISFNVSAAWLLKIEHSSQFADLILRAHLDQLGKIASCHCGCPRCYFLIGAVIVLVNRKPITTAMPHTINQPVIRIIFYFFQSKIEYVPGPPKKQPLPPRMMYFYGQGKEIITRSGFWICRNRFYSVPAQG